MHPTNGHIYRDSCKVKGKVGTFTLTEIDIPPCLCSSLQKLGSRVHQTMFQSMLFQQLSFHMCGQPDHRFLEQDSQPSQDILDPHLVWTWIYLIQ